MGLFSGDEFSLENFVTTPLKTAYTGAKFAGDLVTRPGDALGNMQDDHTDQLAGLGFDRDNVLVKNSDAVAATVMASIFTGGGAGGAVAGGAGAGGATAAGTGATAVGTGVGTTAGANAAGTVAADTAGTVALDSAGNAILEPVTTTVAPESTSLLGDVISSPEFKTGSTLLSLDQQQKAQGLNAVKRAPMGDPSKGAMAYNQQQQQQGYSPYGRGGLLG